MRSDFALAGAAFEPLVAAAKGNAPALLRLAEFAIGHGQPDRAAEIAESAHQIDPRCLLAPISRSAC
jgi:predicted Zn-dependent protease